MQHPELLDIMRKHGVTPTDVAELLNITRQKLTRMIHFEEISDEKRDEIMAAIKSIAENY